MILKTYFARFFHIIINAVDVHKTTFDNVFVNITILCTTILSILQ